MSSARQPIQPPKLEGYRYLNQYLGGGGFSDVFLYEREFPLQSVAVKVLVSDALGEGMRQRFTEEANAMARLSNHPYIVTIYEAKIAAGGYPYLAMEYYPNQNFMVRARTERFSVPSVLRYGIQIAAAVETAHRNNVLHRDIKPANILTSEYGRPGLTDFGIAVAHVGRSDEAEGLSIPWSPPEILLNTGAGDERSDVYSLGATLYTLLAARSPFEVKGGSNRSIDLIDRIERQPVPPIEREEVPSALQRLLNSCMSKDPSARPASAAELARQLQVIEVEERFDMTAFEVSEQGGAALESESIDPNAGVTRFKGPVVVQAQQPTARTVHEVVDDDAFKPGETVSRTTFRPFGGARGQGAELIRNTPYVRGNPATSGPTAARPTPASAGPPPAASDYTSTPTPQHIPAEPMAPSHESAPRRPPPVVLVAVAVAVVLLVVAGLALAGVFSSKPAVAEPSLIPATGVKDQKFEGVWELIWTDNNPNNSADTYIIYIQGRTLPVKTQPFPLAGYQPFTCVAVAVRRGTEQSKQASNYC